MVADPISDFISNIKNANFAGKESVTFFHSSIKEAIADVLVREGFVKSCSKKKKNNKFDIELSYNADKSPKIKEVKRMSKPSRRMYVNASEVTPFKNGYGRVFLTTSKGIMTDKDIKKEKIGGEILFKIW